jgi:hypothetical protein
MLSLMKHLMFSKAMVQLYFGMLVPLLEQEMLFLMKLLVSEYKLFKRSNKANLFIALVQ